MPTPRGGATPKLPSPQTESAKTVPIETPQIPVEVVQTVEAVSEPIATQVNTIETTTIETVTKVDVTGENENMETIETHEITTEVASKPETVESTDPTKLSEPENNEMTGKTRAKRFSPMN